MRVDKKEHDYTEKIKDAIIRLGANLVGVADTEPLKRQIRPSKFIRFLSEGYFYCSKASKCCI